jgi:hypothetical protein
MEVATNHEGGPSQIYLTFGVEPKKTSKEITFKCKKRKTLMS